LLERKETNKKETEVLTAVQCETLLRVTESRYAYIERFNRSFRREVLQAHLFGSLDDVRKHAWDWLVRYNEERPHAALGNLPPSRFRQQQTNPGNSPI
jgi:transposase InsO family protein